MATVFSYIFIYPLLLLLAILPFWAIYLVSDIAYFLGFKILKYRVALVRKNLQLAFPERSNEEVELMLRKAYRNFYDIMLETVKLLVISKKEIHKRMTVGNIQVLQEYKRKEQSVILAIGHIGNWELGAAAYAIHDFPSVRGVYKPLTSTLFDNLMIRIRTRFGGEVYPMEDTVNRMREDSNKTIAVGLLADQSPSSHKAYWHSFLGRETPVFTSVEMLARRFDYPVVYLRFLRLGRGRYMMDAELLTADPKNTEKFEITHKYFDLLEADIRKQPDNYLWTHNRWKRKKEVI